MTSTKDKLAAILAEVEQFEMKLKPYAKAEASASSAAPVRRKSSISAPRKKSISGPSENVEVMPSPQRERKQSVSRPNYYTQQQQYSPAPTSNSFRNGSTNDKESLLQDVKRTLDMVVLPKDRERMIQAEHSKAYMEAAREIKRKQKEEEMFETRLRVLQEAKIGPGVLYPVVGPPSMQGRLSNKSGVMGSGRSKSRVMSTEEDLDSSEAPTDMKQALALARQKSVKSKQMYSMIQTGDDDDLDESALLDSLQDSEYSTNTRTPKPPSQAPRSRQAASRGARKNSLNDSPTRSKTPTSRTQTQVQPQGELRQAQVASVYGASALVSGANGSPSKTQASNPSPATNPSNWASPSLFTNGPSSQLPAVASSAQAKAGVTNVYQNGSTAVSSNGHSSKPSEPPLFTARPEVAAAHAPQAPSYSFTNGFTSGFTNGLLGSTHASDSAHTNGLSNGGAGGSVAAPVTKQRSEIMDEEVIDALEDDFDEGGGSHRYSVDYDRDEAAEEVDEDV